MLFKCQQEPFLKEYNSKVLQCKEIKKGKKKSYEIVLEDTILFAEGGGQPCDHGVLRVLPDNVTDDVASLKLDSVSVSDVQRRDGQAVHTASKPVGVGRDVNIQLDWERRFDHMQQHTGQHLLSAIAEQEPYKYKTVSWNLGSTISHVELNTPTLSADTKSALEHRVNSLIRQGLRVVTKVYTDKTDPALSSAHSRGLPAEHTGPIRVVEIQNVEENMCCGTHLSSLSQIQMIKLMHTECKRGNTLLYFVCGDRVSRTLQDALDIQYKLNALLSSPPELFSSMVEKLSKDSKSHRKQAEKLSAELATVHAAQLASSSSTVLHIHRPTADTDYSLTLQHTLKEVLDKRLLLLTMGEQGSAQFVFRGPVELVERLGKQVGVKLGGKGGGKEGKFQGKFSDLAKIQDTISMLEESVGS